MKTIRIVLLIFILIGIILIITQKIWVSKLVNQVILHENTPTAIQTTSINQPDLSLVDGQQCYEYNHEAIKTEPYTVNEFININIKGTAITGKKTGTQKGPDMTNGYTGTIIGTLDKNTITDIFSYTIEGSSNKEKEIYRANKIGIEKMRYPLIEEKGVLVPDTTKEFTIMPYARVGCIASN